MTPNWYLVWIEWQWNECKSMLFYQDCKRQCFSDDECKSVELRAGKCLFFKTNAGAKSVGSYLSQKFCVQSKFFCYIKIRIRFKLWKVVNITSSIEACWQNNTTFANGVSCTFPPSILCVQIVSIGGYPGLIKTIRQIQ